MSSPSLSNAIADHRVVSPPPERPHVVCVVDGSPNAFSGLATAHRVRAEGRLTVVLVDRWAAFALACPEYAVDPAFLREGGEAWVRERLAEEGIGGADVVVLDHPGALGAWIERARPGLVVVVERRGLPRLVWGSSSRSLARLGASLLVLDPPRRRAERGRVARVPDRAHRGTALLTTTAAR